MLNYFEQKADYSAILSRCPPGPKGTSLSQVQELLCHNGLYAVGFSGATIDSLKCLPYPAILHIQNQRSIGHFLVSIGWVPEKNAFRVYSPPSFYGYMSERDLSAGFSGLGLAISDRPLSSAETLLPEQIALWPAITCLLCSSVTLAWITKKVLTNNNSKDIKSASARSVHSLALSASIVIVPPFLFESVGCNAYSTHAESDREISLGDQVAGPPIEYTFAIKNNSETAFKINNVRRSCSCESVTYNKEVVVDPGDVANVTVEVPTKGRDGPQVYQFLVETSATEGDWSKISLLLRANVSAKIAVNPSQVFLGKVGNNSISTAEIVILSREKSLDECYRGFKFRSPSPVVNVREVDATSTGMMKLEICLPRNAPLGDINETLILEFNDPETPEICVPVMGRVEGVIQSVPQVTVFSTGSPTQKSLELRSRSGEGFVIHNVHVDDAIHVEGIQLGESAVIHKAVIRIEGSIEPGRYYILFETDQLQQREVSVPIHIHN